MINDNDKECHYMEKENLTSLLEHQQLQRSFFARFRPILARVRRSGKQVTLSSAYWAIQSWKKGFKI